MLQSWVSASHTLLTITHRASHMAIRCKQTHFYVTIFQIKKEYEINSSFTLRVAFLSMVGIGVAATATLPPPAEIQCIYYSYLAWMGHC